MAARHAMSLRCPAKINLALSVGAPGAQYDGLHPIASWMVALSFADQLELTRRDQSPSRFDISFDESRQPGQTRAQVDWSLEDDLASRAHALLESHIGGELPIDATLRKRIPPVVVFMKSTPRAQVTVRCLPVWGDSRRGTIPRRRDCSFKSSRRSTRCSAQSTVRPALPGQQYETSVRYWRSPTSPQPRPTTRTSRPAFFVHAGALSAHWLHRGGAGAPGRNSRPLTRKILNETGGH